MLSLRLYLLLLSSIALQPIPAVCKINLLKNILQYQVFPEEDGERLQKNQSPYIPFYLLSAQQAISVCCEQVILKAFA